MNNKKLKYTHIIHSPMLYSLHTHSIILASQIKRCYFYFTLINFIQKYEPPLVLIIQVLNSRAPLDYLVWAAHTLYSPSYKIYASFGLNMIAYHHVLVKLQNISFNHFECNLFLLIIYLYNLFSSLLFPICVCRD